MSGWQDYDGCYNWLRSFKIVSRQPAVPRWCIVLYKSSKSIVVTILIFLCDWHRPCLDQSYLTQRVCNVVSQNSIPTQIHQLILDIRDSKGWVDRFVGELTSAKTLPKHFVWDKFNTIREQFQYESQPSYGELFNNPQTKTVNPCPQNPEP